jgi:vacuolar-type H+-ATPase subunit I/STV1
LIKKVTIITPPEYEGLILESLGKAKVTQLKPVTGTDFDSLREGAKDVDFAELYDRFHTKYQELLELSEGEIESSFLGKEELREFAANPEEEAIDILLNLENVIPQLQELRDSQTVERNAVIKSLQEAVEEKKSEYEKAKADLEQERAEIESKYVGAKARLESIRALKPEEFKSCFAVGLAENKLIPQLEEYLKRYPNVFHRTVEVTPEKSFIFIFGPEEGRKWVESLFLVFDVKDVFDVLDTGDILLVLDPKKREDIIAKYNEDLRKIETERVEKVGGTGAASGLSEMDMKLKELRQSHELGVEELKTQYDLKLKELKIQHLTQVKNIKDEQSSILGKVSYVDNLLRILSNRRAPVLRGKVISVIQGWVPEYNLSNLEGAIKEVEGQIGERLFYEYEEPSKDDTAIPNPEPQFKPSILQPAWTLTYLRGWPSAKEINPGYISILVFSFQFGLMYGDIGQGLVFLLIGLFLYRKYKSVGHGMMYRLGGMFIPMGISAMIFGVMYDSIFLIEGLLFHHHQPLPNPVHQTTKLMLIVFQIAMIEVVAGLVLGAINQIKAGNPIGALGEHGLGMILYVVGLYYTAMYFISIGMDFMAALGSPWFIVALAGIFLSFLEPIIHSVKHGHGVGMESIGEGVGGLLMTFVEGLANLFSFLRIAAFALAHASLAIAAEALSHSLGIAGVGLIIMNVIALSFEFVSSTVQSLRLLYYEFMGKFFQGGGIPFRPFSMRVANKK